jgi:uncharacterized protein
MAEVMLRHANGAFRHCLARQTSHARFHYQHGPIDIIAELFGAPNEIDAAALALWERFYSILPELVPELTLLKSDVRLMPPERAFDSGTVARRMCIAASNYASEFLTPMAAVAGSVADELLEVAITFDLAKVILNNGGDIALYLAPFQQTIINVLAPVGQLRLQAQAQRQCLGVATSGWSGRSFSLGIADAVTVIGVNAAFADAAATVIANQVGPTLVHAGIVRRPASELKDDSDLGQLPVTVSVSSLPLDLVRTAIDQGRKQAHDLLRQKKILSASICLQSEFAFVHDDFQPYFYLQDAA